MMKFARRDGGRGRGKPEFRWPPVRTAPPSVLAGPLSPASTITAWPRKTEKNQNLPCSAFSPSPLVGEGRVRGPRLLSDRPGRADLLPPCRNLRILGGSCIDEIGIGCELTPALFVFPHQFPLDPGLRFHAIKLLLRLHTPPLSDRIPDLSQAVLLGMWLVLLKSTEAWRVCQLPASRTGLPAVRPRHACRARGPPSRTGDPCAQPRRQFWRARCHPPRR